MNPKRSREQANETSTPFVCFKLADEEYALDIHCTREVLRIPSITPVPQMPPFCLGVICIRGNIIPVFDLRRKFKLPEKPFGLKTKLLVMFVDNLTISIIVDEILENIDLKVSEIGTIPPVKMKMESDCIRGIGELESRMLIILDLPNIHKHIKDDIQTFSTNLHKQKAEDLRANC